MPVNFLTTPNIVYGPVHADDNWFFEVYVWTLNYANILIIFVEDNLLHDNKKPVMIVAEKDIMQKVYAKTIHWYTAWQKEEKLKGS